MGEYRILDSIDSPQDLKMLSISKLKKLAEEIREEIIWTVSRTGGHLASNLGVVELTIALHFVMNSPRDKIIWDVGHQGYAHKLLTGRRDRFHTLRQYGGISGFLRREESEHDIFNAGHASTSIAAALGIAKARDLRGENHSVIAVIGDGALTAGMALEALNQAGHLGHKLMVILNDNEMSISKNVGALSAYVHKLRLNPLYRSLEKDTKLLVKKIPGVGDMLDELAKRTKDGLKHILVDGVLFEEFGFIYIGLLDGHDLELLINVISAAKDLDDPVFLHVVTKKGQGYKPACENPTKFHSAKPFDISKGVTLADKDSSMTYSEIFGETIVELARTDEKIVGITAAMPDGTKLKKFSQVFPSRFFDVGIAEQTAVTMGAGLATQGFRPVVAIYSTFLQRAYDQIAHDVCLQNLPVIFAIDRAGLVGDDGPTHHGVFDFTYLRHLPNIVVMAAKDGNELRNMLATAIEYEGPIAVRYPKGKGGPVHWEEPFRSIPIGQAEILREGEDLAILAIGAMVYPSLEAAEILADRWDIEATVVNSRFVKPLDEDLIKDLAKKVGKIVTVEENNLPGGFGSAVLELLSLEGMADKLIKRIGLPDKFIEHGDKEILYEKCGLTAPGIAQGIISALGRKGEEQDRGEITNPEEKIRTSEDLFREGR